MDRVRAGEGLHSLFHFAQAQMRRHRCQILRFREAKADAGAGPEGTDYLVQGEYLWIWPGSTGRPGTDYNSRDINRSITFSLGRKSYGII